MAERERRVPDLPEADAYLSEIGVLGDMRVEIDECCRIYETLFENTDYKLFLSERKNNEGERIFENLWFFSEDGISEYKNFLRSESSNIDFVSPKIALPAWIDMHAKDFRPGSTGNNSTMSLNAKITTGDFGMKFSATGLNCEHLYQIFKFMKSMSII